MTEHQQSQIVLVSEEPRPQVLETYDVHPVAGLWPLLSPSDLQEMARDIKQHGQLEPVWLHNDQVLDGRNRIVACDMAGVQPRFQPWKPTQPGDTPITFIMSKNLHRRHLSASVRAAVAVSVEEWILDERARVDDEQWKIAANVTSENPAAAAEPEVTDDPLAPLFSNKTEPQKSPPPVRGLMPTRGRAREQAAKVAGVSTGYVADAKDVKKASPDMFNRVARGEITLPKAQEELVAEATRTDSLDALKMRPGAVRAATERLDEREKKKFELPKFSKFSKVSSSKVAVSIEAVFGSAAKAEEWMDKMEMERSVLKMNYSVHDASEYGKPKSKTTD